MLLPNNGLSGFGRSENISSLLRINPRQTLRFKRYKRFGFGYNDLCRSPRLIATKNRKFQEFTLGKVTIYHNPRCSKSRYTLELIKSSGYEPEIVRYLEDPPKADTLDALIRALGKQPLEVMRTKESRFKELGLSKDDDRPRGEWIKLMVENPVLIERPIVVHDRQVAIGRPPENVLDIL